MATNETVYEGFWVNWEDGPARGATLTLNKRDAAFLIAFLALYVTLAGTHFWQLLCWITFQLRSSGHDPALQDDPVQTLLRNSESSTAATIDFGHVAWVWWKESKRLKSRRLQKLQRAALWLHVSAVLIMVGFLVSGIFSSRVTNTRSDVLLRPSVCGYWTKLATDQVNCAHDIVRVSRWEGQTSVNWADSSLLTQYCARHNAGSACMPPGREFVRWTSSVQDSCPFQTVPCTSQALVLDSGLVDSSQHLGVNTPKQDRVAFRKRLTCSPIDASSYTHKYDQTNITQLWPPQMSANPSDNVLVWLEPELSNPSRSKIYNGSLFDAIFLGQSNFDAGMEATFVQNEALWMNYNSGRTKGSGEAYAVQVQQHVSGGPEALDVNKNRFIPPSGLTRENSSTLLMFLMNGYTYSDGSVDDPWFQTTNSSTTPHGAYAGESCETWWADYDAIGTLACFEDTEICNAASETPLCASTNPYGSILSGEIFDVLKVNTRQKMLIERLTDALGKSTFGDMVVELNGASMLARKRSYDNTGSTLPPN